MPVQNGRDLYMKRCFWCHGEAGQGDGPSADGMFPRPRDFVRADYRLRTTPFGSLPTDDDLARVIRDGIPATPMAAWKDVLSEAEIAALVGHLKSLSPRFAAETPAPIGPAPASEASAERGRKAYESAKCFLCHGDEGRGDGPITTTLNFEWGQPFSARNFHQGWTFKGGSTPADIYSRVTTGLNGTPMGPYADLLTDAERWDLAHYVASLNDEPSAQTEVFHVTAAFVEGELPSAPDDAAWSAAAPVVLPLAGQIVRDPPLRWWFPTARSVTVRALWNDREVAFLLEWDDPTESTHDGAMLGFPEEGERPHFLDVKGVWKPDVMTWRAGRRRAVARGPLPGDRGAFVPMLVSVQDSANAERDDVRALTTWYFVHLEPPGSPKPYLLGAAHFLGAILVMGFVARRVRRRPA